MPNPAVWDEQRAIDELWDRSDYERGRITDPFGGDEAAERGLRRTGALLAALGNPQDACPVVHVAGSKGKGSTSAMAEAILRAAGCHTGLFTSPHLHAFRERIALDGVPVPGAHFAALCQSATRAAREVERADPGLGRVTTFELVTAMGFLGFARADCDVAVVEVGLGGRWDATNVVDPLVAVVTRIDLEHTAILGDTLALIAAQKAAIIKPGRPAVVGPQPAEARAVFRARAAATGSPLLVGGVDWQTAGTWRDLTLAGPWGTFDHLALALPGAYQVENAGTAVAACWVAAESGLPVTSAAIREGLATTRWPGRFERVTAEGRTLLLDGAHTPAAAAALAAAVAEELPGVRATAVVGISRDKDAAEILGALAPVLGRVVATRSANPRAADAATVEAAARRLGLPTGSAATVAAALRIARSDPAPLVLVTGSLFTVADAREVLGIGVPDPPPRPGPARVDGVD